MKYIKIAPAKYIPETEIESVEFRMVERTELKDIGNGHTVEAKVGEQQGAFLTLRNQTRITLKGQDAEDFLAYVNRPH